MALPEVRTRERATSTAMKETVLTSRAQAMPWVESTMAASAGPMMRPRLNWAELRLTALCRSSGGTSSETRAEKPGLVRVLVQPLRKEMTATAGTVRWPVKASTVRMPASRAWTMVPTAT